MDRDGLSHRRGPMVETINACDRSTCTVFFVLLWRDHQLILPCIIYLVHIDQKYLITSESSPQCSIMSIVVSEDPTAFENIDVFTTFIHVYLTK